MELSKIQREFFMKGASFSGYEPNE